MAPPLVFNYIGIVLTAIFYGVYCMIFGLYWRIQLVRLGTHRWKGVFVYPHTASFILCTVFMIIVIIKVQFSITMAVLNEDSLVSPYIWMTVASNALYATIDFISQLILLYRCWIVWHKPSVMVIPCILSLAFLATALTTLGIQIKDAADNLPLSDWFLSAVTASSVLSLSVNIFVTTLIVYKIITEYHEIRGLTGNASNLQASTHGNGQRDLYPIIVSILIESGLITFVGQLIQIILLPQIASAAFPEVSFGGPSFVVMLFVSASCRLLIWCRNFTAQGISTTVVLVRVESCVSCDQTKSGATNSTDLERPINRIQFRDTPVSLSPFASESKLNQTTAIDDMVSDDTHSERKLIRPNGYT